LHVCERFVSCYTFDAQRDEFAETWSFFVELHAEERDEPDEVDCLHGLDLMNRSNLEFVGHIG
jgi:hypothetical protein